MHKILHYAVALCSFVGLVLLLTAGDFGWLAVSLVYYKLIVGLFGNQLAQHRYFSHASFVTTRFKEWMLYFASLTTGVNPVWYALSHRHHHVHSDTDKDVHSVHNRWLDIFMPLTVNSSYKGNVHISRVLPKHLRQVNRFWLIIFSLYILVAALINWKIAVFVILTGPAWNYLHMILFRVWLVHVKLPGSYQNFDAGDHSYNNKFLQVLDIGEGLHNNHHQYPNRYNQAIKPDEFDPAGWLVDRLFVSK
jgi:stearoyl-CoA desaturase (delta-9 desaturase)